MPTHLECPKCSRCRAWVERDGPDLVLRSICGVFTVLETKGPADTIIERSEAEPRNIRLPRPGTALSSTLGQLAAMVTANSAKITEALSASGRVYSVSDCSSYLTILRVKGLVRATVVRRGLPGGSTWELTITAKRLLGLGP